MPSNALGFVIFTTNIPKQPGKIKNELLSRVRGLSSTAADNVMLMNRIFVFFAVRI